MAERKIFAGARIRRIRLARGLSQTAMANALGISASYLNLIERNQRPLTVQLLLKLASVFQVEPDELHGGDAGNTLSALREIFADPLLAGELPGETELVELAEAAPNVAAGIIRLYRAYRERGERLTDLAALLAHEGHRTALSAARLPMDEVREQIASRPHHFPRIEEEAEAFHALLQPEEGLMQALRAWLGREHGISVRTLPVSAMPDLRRRYDRHSKRLFISERLSPFNQLREVAMESMMLRADVAITAEIEAMRLSTEESRRLARFEFGRYGAHALMMPYGAFHAAALRARYDIDVLRARFGVSYEQAASRLVTLARPGSAGVPFFLLEADQAGNRIRLAGAEGFPQQRFGGGCPRLAVHAAFSQPGQILVEAVETPEGARFLTIARTLEGPQGSFGERPRRTALLLGCDLDWRNELVYGAALPGQTAEAGVKSPPVPATPIGPSCRLCERRGCLSRAEPPITRPLGLDEMATGLSLFDFR